MKRINQLVSILFIFLFMGACKKDNKCHVFNKQIFSQHEQSDMSQLGYAPKIRDSLNKYPQLKVFRIVHPISNTTVVHCEVFYHHLQILSDNYVLVEDTEDGTISSIGEFVKHVDLPSFEPEISGHKAVRIAKKEIHFQGCVTYQLGITDINHGKGADVPENYKLVWIVGKFGQKNVVLDAITGKIYRKFNGITVCF